MPRVSINMSDEEHAQYKIACIKNGETMTEAGRKMLALYSSGLLFQLWNAWPTRRENTAFEDVAESIGDWLEWWQQGGEEEE